MSQNQNPREEETRRDWEVIQQNVGDDKTERLKINNGWLYRCTSSGGNVALVFVPDER